METVDVEKHLRQHAAGIAGRLAQTHAELVHLTRQVMTARVSVGDGINSYQHWLQIMTGVSPSVANQLVRVAERVEELPETIALMEHGRMSLDQAAVVAQYAPAGYSPSVTFLAEQLTVTQLRRLLSRYQFATPETTDADEKPAREYDELSMHTSDGRFRLRLETNAADGALIETAIREAKDALFTTGDTTATLVDGLVEIANRSLSGIQSTSRRNKYRVLVHLDADHTGWISKGRALPQHLLKQLTCDGTLKPVWQIDGAPVSVGRGLRIVPDRTRHLIEDRDQGCRYPGCPTTGFLENHHITHWADGGATDLDTLVSLCPKHHRDHHTGDYTISGNPNTPGGLTFTAQGGWTITTQLAPDEPPPDRPPPGWNRPQGETLDTSYIEFTPGPRVQRQHPGDCPVIPPPLSASGC